MKRTYQKPVLVKRGILTPLVARTSEDTTPESDLRLKADIVQVGMLMAGVPLYRFRYIWGEEVFVGVMAQDVLKVRPDAVITDAAGFMSVDYAALGTRMVRWDDWQAANAAALPIEDELLTLGETA